MGLRGGVKLLFWFSASLLLTGCLAQNLDEEKQVKKGDTISLDCQDQTKKDYCVWTTPSVPVITDSDPPSADYVLSFNKDTGICTMLVVSVDNKDNGRWTCIVGGGEGRRIYNLVVLAPPQETYFLYENDRLDDDITDLTTEKFKLSCVAKDSNPGATIKWKIDNGELFDGTIEDPKGPSGPLFTVTSTIEVELPTPDSRFYYSSGLENYKHEKRVECIIEHPALAEPTILKKYIARKYATQEVSIKHDGEGGVVTMKEGEEAKFFCKADGNPQPDERSGYEFYKLENAGRRLLHTGQNFTVLEEGDYQCDAANELITGEKVSSKPVTVKFGEKITDNTNNQANKSQSADTGLVVGIVVGALLLLAIVGGVTLFLFKKQQLCFAGIQSGTHNIDNAERNGVSKSNEKEDPSPETKLTTEEKPQGDQNENNTNKPKEVVYAQLDLNNGNKTVPPKPKEEQTEYAQIKFPKENQV